MHHIPAFSFVLVVVASCSLFDPTAIATGSPDDRITVIGPDHPLPNVVAGRGPDDADAAKDLCHYLSRVTGRKIVVTDDPAAEGVVIHVGNDGFVRKHAPGIRDLHGDGFIIRHLRADTRDHLILAGLQAPSAQWAVERFLQDHCGVRWLLPHSEYGEVVPSRPIVSIPATLSERYEPDYVARSNCSMYMHSPAGKYARLGPRGGQFGSHEIQIMFSTEEFAAHPEWFSFFKGKRQWWKYGNGWQICTTNPETVTHAVAYIDAFFQRDPDALVASVGQNDGSGWCECSACTSFVNSFDPPYTPTERWFAWVNQVAHEVKKRHPNKWVEAMAYANTSSPPRFKLEDNVAITKTFVLDGEFAQAEQWMSVCKSVNLYSYMYGNSFMGFRHYPHAAQEFLQWGHEKLGAMSHVTECGGDWSFDAPKYHYLQALQWDVDADVNAVMDDFCSASYGSAATPMRAFWDRFEAIYDRRPTTPYGEKHKRWLFYQWVAWTMNSYVQPNDEFTAYTMDDVAYLDDRMEEASRFGADDSEAVQFRIARVADAWHYYRTMVVSVLKYYPMSLDPEVAGAEDAGHAVALAREIAEGRAQRRHFGQQMRRYPTLNPRLAGRNYWSWGEGLTLFGHEQALIDALCSAISTHRRNAGGFDATLASWHETPSSDPLHPFAQTQAFLLACDTLPNLLVNGGFEHDTLDGWEVVGGTAQISHEGARSGKAAVHFPHSSLGMIRQRVAVEPRARYQFTAWAKHLATPPDWVAPMEAILEFHSGSQRLWPEPSRCVWRIAPDDTGWHRLRGSVTAPPGADSVFINLKRRFHGTHAWDDVAFQCILKPPPVAHGILKDAFDENPLSGNQWGETTAHRMGSIPPKIEDGWLRFRPDESHPLTSLPSFNELLQYDGEGRYRLRFKVAVPGGLPQKETVWSLGVKSGTGPISTSDTGMFSYIHFPSEKRSTPMVSSFCFQSNTKTVSSTFALSHFHGPKTHSWFTFRFDPRQITIYASPNGYDESDAATVGTFEHGITDLTADGPVFLKLDTGHVRIDEIELTRPDGQAGGTSIDETAEPGGDDPRRLFMPGVSE